MKPERYAPGDYLGPLTAEDRKRKVKIKWPGSFDDKGLSQEREVEIIEVLSRNTARVDYKGSTFELSRFCMRGVKP